jgi:single-stranded-DNA-specific exonuclease
MLKGSGRSYGNCDLFAVVDKARPLLEKFGGHFAAVGLSLQEAQLETFRTVLQEHYGEGNYVMDERDPDIVGTLDFETVSFDLIERMKRFEPYGQGNPVPKFITYGVRILQASPMGKEGNHLRFLFEHNGITHQGVQFKTEETYAPGAVADIVYTVNENHFRGNVTLQLMVEEVIPHRI